jgi:hypothetical protein
MGPPRGLQAACLFVEDSAEITAGCVLTAGVMIGPTWRIFSSSFGFFNSCEWCFNRINSRHSCSCSYSFSYGCLELGVPNFIGRRRRVDLCPVTARPEVTGGNRRAREGMKQYP